MTLADATTLIGLARIKRFDLLQIAFTEITIAQAVYQEVVIKGMGKPGAQEVQNADWIHVQTAQDQEAVKKLRSSIGHGESETIVLAKELKADTILLDDGKARAIASREGLTVSGVLGLLLFLKRRGDIVALKPILDELKTAGFRMGDEYHAILQAAGEDSS